MLACITSLLFGVCDLPPPHKATAGPNTSPPKHKQRNISCHHLPPCMCIIDHVAATPWTQPFQACTVDILRAPTQAQTPAIRPTQRANHLLYTFTPNCCWYYACCCRCCFCLHHTAAASPVHVALRQSSYPCSPTPRLLARCRCCHMAVLHPSPTSPSWQLVSSCCRCWVCPQQQHQLPVGPGRAGLAVQHQTQQAAVSLPSAAAAAALPAPASTGRCK